MILNNIVRKSVWITVITHVLMVAEGLSFTLSQLQDIYSADIGRIEHAIDPADLMVASRNIAEASPQNSDRGVQAEDQTEEIHQPFMWEHENYFVRFWGNIRNLTNYNHLDKHSLLNPNDIFHAPKFINFSQAKLKLDANIGNTVGLFIHDRLQYEVVESSADRKTDFENELDQAFATFEFGEEILTFLSIGKQRIKWGTGRLWTPVDTLNPQQDLTQLEPIETGRISYRADVTNGPVTVTGVAVPNADSNSASCDNFRFENNRSLFTGKIDFFVWDSDLALYLSDEDQEDLRIGASFATVLSGIQYFGEAVFWNGESERVYVVQKSEREPVFDPVGNTSFVLPAEFEVETRSGYYNKLLLGIQYTFSNDITIIFEYYYRKDGYDSEDMQTYIEFLEYAGGQYADDVASTIVAKERNPLLSIPDFPSQEALLSQGTTLYDFARLRRNYLHFSTFWRYLAGNRFDIGLESIINLDDLIDDNGGSYFVRPLITYTGLQDWRFTLYSQLYLGSDDTEFGIFPYDWGAFFQIRYFF